MSLWEEKLEHGLEWLAVRAHYFFWGSATFQFLAFMEIIGIQTPLRLFLTGLDEVRHNLIAGVYFGTAFVLVTSCAVRLTFWEWWDARFER